MKARVCIRAVMIAATLALPAVAGAQGIIDGFFRGKGKADFALSYNYENYDQFWVGSEKMDSPGELGAVTTESINLFVAYGLSEDIDLVGSLPWIQASGDGAAPPPDQDGFQDAAAALKWRFAHGSSDSGEWGALVSGGLSTPLEDYLADSPIAIGHHSTNGDFKVGLQYKTSSGLFAFGQGGYSFRSDQVPDAVLLGAKAGYAGAKLYAAAFLDWQNSVDGTDIMEGPFPSNEIDYLRAGADLYVPIAGSFGLSFGAGFTLDGKNVGQATRLGGAIVFRVGG